MQRRLGPLSLFLKLRTKHRFSGHAAVFRELCGDFQKTNGVYSGNLHNLSPKDQAQALKNKGNKYFKGGMYEQAIDCYTEAITICPSEHKQDISTFYQNRAAAYENLKNYQLAVSDCTMALELNDRYVKAFARRARLLELQQQYRDSLEDITTVCILEGFQNQNSLKLADRILKELGRSRAKQAYQGVSEVQRGIICFKLELD